MNRGIMRFLMMFGPLIFRQYQKYKQKKQRQQYNQSRIPQDTRQQQPQDNRGRSSQSREKDYSQHPPQDGRYYKGSNDNYQRQQPPQPAPTKKTPPVLSEDEKNFNLKEEEFMLDPNTHANYKSEMDAIEANAKMSHEELTDEKITLDDNPQLENKSTNNPIERNDKDDDGFNIRDLFLKPEEDEESDT